MLSAYKSVTCSLYVVKLRSELFPGVFFYTEFASIVNVLNFAQLNKNYILQTCWVQCQTSWTGGDNTALIPLCKYILELRYLNDNRRTSLIMTPKRSPHVLPFQPGVRELLPSFGVPSQVLVRKTPKAALRESPTLRNTLKPTTRESPGLTGTLMALLRMQFEMEGQECTSSTQEAKKTKLASLPAYTPQTMKLK